VSTRSRQQGRTIEPTARLVLAQIHRLHPRSPRAAGRLHSSPLRCEGQGWPRREELDSGATGRPRPSGEGLQVSTKQSPRLGQARGE
jgi:hypothetical protein